MIKGAIMSIMLIKTILALSLLVVSGLVASCSSSQQKASLPRPIIREAAKTVEIYTGKVAYESFPMNAKNGTYNLRCGAREIPVLVEDNMAKAYLVASYFSATQEVDCLFDGKKVLGVKVSKFNYPKEKLNVAKGKVFYSKKDLKRIIKEKEVKKHIYTKTAPEYLFDRPFVAPLNSFITSHYGNQRLFNNAKKSQHLGNDFRAKVGVKIPASNRGRVAFTGDLFFIGKVVVLDHGLGIFTVYGHLSQIRVNKGDMVKQGDIVGLSGRTGRVSGPHLHWGVKINGSWVDGFSLVEASQEQFAMLN